MIILGVSCFFHDAAAALLRDGELVAAAQEERFSRKKNDQRFPLHAINFCLEEAGIDEDEVDAIAFYENPVLALDRIAYEMSNQPFDVAVRQLDMLNTRWANSKLCIAEALRQGLPAFRGRVFLVDHHHSHAAASFYASPFSEAAILTVDGVGEWATAAISIGEGARITRVCDMQYPHSLGLLYSAATHYLGFKVNSGEYKVMGLAAYGVARFEADIKKNIVSITDDGSLRLNLDYFDMSGISGISTTKWESLFGRPKRCAETEVDSFHADIAASFQKVTEDILIKMVRHARLLTKKTNLCLGGGVALNCVANRKILDDGSFADVWVQPASGDAGSSLGAALALWHDHIGAPRIRSLPDSMKGGFLGPEYSDDEVRDFLEIYGFPYEQLKVEEMAPRVAQMLSRGMIVGLLQGRMEFGPRALGARSIIADPRTTKMQLRINKSIKFRETFRPFAPVVLEREASNWFDMKKSSPYMLFVAPVALDKRYDAGTLLPAGLKQRLERERSLISAVTHVDYSARVQTIADDYQLPLKDILEEFYSLTGTPVLVNTSFNLRGEPIVCTPADAYRCMMRSQIDAVVMGNVLIIRDEQPDWNEASTWKGALAD